MSALETLLRLAENAKANESAPFSRGKVKPLRGSAECCAVAPIAPPGDAVLPKSWAGGVLRRALCVVCGVIRILHPFGDVPLHVVQSKSIGFFLPYRVAGPAGVVIVPCVKNYRGGIITKKVRTVRSPSGSVFPFRFCGQAVSGAPF